MLNTDLDRRPALRGHAVLHQGALAGTRGGVSLALAPWQAWSRRDGPAKRPAPRGGRAVPGDGPSSAQAGRGGPHPPGPMNQTFLGEVPPHKDASVGHNCEEK